MTDRKFSGVMEMQLPQNILSLKDRARYVVIEPNYLYEGEEKEQRNQEIESARDTCLSGISDLSDEYEKIKYIYTYLIDNVDYDLDAPDNQNIYSALVGKRSVCAGYAKSCQYLLQQLGISCIYVTGQTTDPNGGVADLQWILFSAMVSIIM